MAELARWPRWIDDRAPQDVGIELPATYGLATATRR
jgi:hypothetical protein